MQVQSSTFQIVIETSLGQLQVENLDEFTLFQHEYLQHKVSQNGIGEITVMNYQKHFDNPFNTVNTSVTPTLILHQLQCITKPLVMDYSNCKDLTPYKNLAVIKGTRFEIGTVSKSQGDYLYSKATIKQNFLNNFSLNEPKPIFIGQFILSQIDLSNEYYINGIQAAFSTCKEIGCFCVFNFVNNQNSKVLFEQNNEVINETYDKLSKILKINQKYGAKVLVFNPFVLFPSQITNNHSVNKQHKSLNLIEQIRKQGAIVGYDILRYCRDKDFILLLIQELKKYPDTSLLSHGALFKTDLTTFGGFGFARNQVLQLIKSKLSSQDYDKLTRKTMISLLLWKKKQIVVKQIQYWKCDTCGKQSSEQVQRFRKLGKEFCSTACIRGYKF